MEKETLRFKIARKVITYEGYPTHRARDLIDILAKLNVAEDTVVQTFRDNIENESEYTDEAILEMFTGAVKARAERKRRQQEEAAAAAAAANNGENNNNTNTTNASPRPPDTERPRKITLSYRGRQFSYEGLLSGKQRAVLQLLCKQKDVTREIAVETFHNNLPDVTLSDEEIWQLVCDTLNAKQRGHGKEAHAEGNGQVQQQQQQQAAAEVSPRPPTTQGASVAETNSASNNNNGASSQEAGGHHGSADHSAVGELANMSSKERDDLNNFIRQVLEQPPMDLANLLSEEPRARSTENDENVGVLLTARTSGKIIVYCQEDGSTSTKVVHATPEMKYSEFASIIERKFGRPMALSFYEGDDVIELDDDDGLAMFLEMCTQAANNRKVRLICSDPATRRHVVEDLVTAERPAQQLQPQAQVQVQVPQQMIVQQPQQQPANTRVMPYSNGELKVQLLRTYTGHTLAVYSCSFSPRGDFFVTASRDRSVRLWNTKTGSCSVMKGGHNGFVLSCHFSPKGNRVVSSSDDRTIKIWNTTTCNKVCTLKGHEDKVYSVQYNSTGEYIVSGSCDHTVRVWNAESFSKMVTLKGHTLAVFSCGFSNSDRGHYVVSGSDDRLIKIWDWGSGREVRSLVGHIGTVWSVCFSHSDRYIVSASMDHELKLWEAGTGVCVRTMNGHATPIHHAIFSDNDQYIFSCARDWSTMVWRTDNGERVEIITGHQSTVYHMDVQGNRLLTSSLDDTLCLWEVTPNAQNIAVATAAVAAPATTVIAAPPPAATVQQIVVQQQQ